MYTETGDTRQSDGQLAHMQALLTFMFTKWPFGMGFFLSITKKFFKKSIQAIMSS